MGDNGTILNVDYSGVTQLCICQHIELDTKRSGFNASIYHMHIEKINLKKNGNKIFQFQKQFYLRSFISWTL